MIEIKNLSKSFGDKLVLNDLNVKIPDSKIFGLVGINGAGKSTLLRIISGVFKSDEGNVLVDGEEVFENTTAKSKIFFLPDEPFYSNNTTASNVCDMYLAFYNFDKKEYLDYINDFKLPLNKPLSTFSKGMKRQVFVSLALAIKPKYLLLDEAFDGLDPLARLKFKRSIINLVEENKTTVIISSHSLRELEDICDSYGLIDGGVIKSTGDIQEAISSYHKYQVAFSEIVTKEDFDLEFVSYQQDRRVIKVVVREELDEFSKKIEKFNPLIIDEINIDFEELFIIEVESRGYIKWENY